MMISRVVWHEGMLLRPQHFQQNDRYYDHQLKARTQLLHSCAHGFFNLAIDHQFLAMGKLVLSQASGILPAGSQFELGSGHSPLSLDVPPKTSNCAVWLALPLVTGNDVEARRPQQQDVLARSKVPDRDVRESTSGADCT